ncbi:MAG: mono/diheme cytochrome c family protein [Salibacteraceae bacterium]|jgi:mono/diheme cytochrome c family protein
MKTIQHSRYIIAIFLSSIFIFGFLSLPTNNPSISLNNYLVEEGFELSMVASEPQLKAPVSMDFDNNGRIWVVEMIGYMPNIEGIGEEEKNGRITILEDLDKDGYFEDSKIFMDELVLPRAIALVYGGVLYVDGPELWFAEIKNDLPTKKTLVDPKYADAGNVEHQPNGLMMNLDNWIYNANSNFRYRKLKGKWLKEPTSYRGQWGITKDNFGRLYYNSNATQIKGDFLFPNIASNNEYFKPVSSENQKLTNDQSVYAIQATSVNRGYQKGVLDENGRVKKVTAACGPLVYRGGQFPESYDLNAFVCVPEANSIKRNILTFDNLQTKATQAYKGKEFISSYDEGFRPVNLFTGPDGAMYIVDMHRGIIQHKAFISQYLSNLLAQKKLDTLQNLGRILKVVNKNKNLPIPPKFSQASTVELLSLLHSPNGWIRDRAQHLLIIKGDKSIKKELVNLAKSSSENHANLHALYVLEGLEGLSFSILQEIINKSKQEETVAHALHLLNKFASIKNSPKMASMSNELASRDNEIIDLYLISAMDKYLKLKEEPTFEKVLVNMANKYKENKIINEVITSSLGGLEEYYLPKLNFNKNLESNLSLAIKNRSANEPNPIFVNTSVKEDSRTNGLKLFRNICGACHGADGSGIEDMAPPLKNSEYIDGSMNRLASILLFGISGPLHVNGKLYDLNTEMPALAHNTDLDDQDIADIVKYTQNAFAKNIKGISANDIKKIREKKPFGENLMSEEQLLNYDFDK